MAFDRTPELVSIVVPSYNQAKYAEECFESLRKQTYPRIELVMVDDASTDGFDKQVERWAQSFKPHSVVTIRLPRRVGYAGALTIGMFLTRGEYIAIQDLDDFSHRERIEKQVNFLKEHLDIDLVGTNMEFFRGKLFKTRRACNWIEFGDDINKSFALGRPAMCLSTVLFRGVIFDYLGGLTRQHNGTEDVDLIRKYITNGISVDNLPEVLYYARQHDGQRSRSLDIDE